MRVATIFQFMWLQIFAHVYHMLEMKINYWRKEDHLMKCTRGFLACGIQQYAFFCHFL